MISIIIPVFNEEMLIVHTLSAIKDVLQKEVIPFELVVVDDGSTDRSWDKVKEFEKENKEVKVRAICFSRNFGKEAALMAGLAYAKGEAVVTIDSDLQHPPEKIVEMYALWKKGYKIVEGIKTNRGKEAYLHKLFSTIFYNIMSYAVQVNMKNTTDYKLLDREVVDIIVKMPEKQMFYRAISAWVGFESTTVEFCVKDRTEGISKWSYRTLVRYAVRNMTSFSTAPLQLVTLFGGGFLLFASFMGILALGKYFSHEAVPGFTTVILIQLFSGGVLMLAVGLIGIYIAKIYEEVRKRPRYIIKKELKNKENES